MSAMLETGLDAERKAAADAWDAKAAAAMVADAARFDLAQEVGRLTAEVNRLRGLVAMYEGKDQRPQVGAEFSEQSLEEASVLVEYEYISEEEPIYDADHPGVGPGHPAEVNVLGVLINGAWINPHDCLREEVVQRWIELIYEERDGE